MAARLAPANKAIFSGSGFAALLLAAWCSPSLAATGVDIKCPESERDNDLVVTDVEIPSLAIPPLKIDVVDHGVDSSADIEAEIVDPPLVRPAANNGSDENDSATDVDEADAAINEAAPAARLPGVSEADQPRFRRQMYRTDI